MVEFVHWVLFFQTKIPSFQSYFLKLFEVLLQRFSEVTDQLGMTILSVIPGNPFLWAFLMENFNLGIAKMSVIPENPLFPNPVLPKTSVCAIFATKAPRWVIINNNSNHLLT